MRQTCQWWFITCLQNSRCTDEYITSRLGTALFSRLEGAQGAHDVHEDCAFLLCCILVCDMYTVRGCLSSGHDCVCLKPRCMMQVLGLSTLRFFAALIPTLLSWCHDPILATQLEALQVLRLIVQHTWPRIPVHAPFMWGQLLKIAAQHEACCMQSGQGCESSTSNVHERIKEVLCSIAEMLYWCSGSVFREQLLAVKQASILPSVLLQAIRINIETVA